MLLSGILLGLSSAAEAQTSVGEGNAARVIEVPPLGVPVEPHRGFYTDFGIGTYFAFGPGGVSDAQPLLGLGLGYDLGDRLTLGMRVAMGAVSGMCLAGTCGGLDPTAPTDGADSFTLLMGDLFLGYFHPLTPQWFVGGKVLAGVAAIGPLPAPPSGEVPQRLGLGFGGGVLASTELHTYLNHFVIGADLGANYRSGGGAGVLGIEIAARFKYVF